VSRWDTTTLRQITEIRKIWGDTLEKNLAVAQIVAKLRLGKANYNNANLPFQFSWFCKLKKIAAHKEINDPQYREIMPDARRTLYQISRLNSKLFLLALDEGMIHPRVTAEEIETWRKRKLGVPNCSPVKLTITRKVPREDEAEPDEEDRDMLISTFRADLEEVGFHLSDRSGLNEQYMMTEKNPSRIDILSSDVKTRGPIRE